MSTIEEITEAIEGRLATIPGLTVWGYPPGQTDYPAAFLNLYPEIDYRDSAADDQLHVFEIVVLVSAALNENIRTGLPFLEREGPQSIFAVFESQRTLGLNDVDAHIRSARPLDLEDVGGYHAYGAALTLVVAQGP